MARHQVRRGRHAAQCVAISGVAFLAIQHWTGPAYVVKSSWEGEAGSLKDYAGIVKGLEPSIALPALSFEGSDGLRLSVEGGHLAANYKGQLGKDTSLDVHVHDDLDWTAALKSGKAAVKVQGHGSSLDEASWEASHSSSADGVGDVSLYFNSSKYYKMTIVNDDLGGARRSQVESGGARRGKRALSRSPWAPLASLVAGTSFSGKLTAEPKGMVGFLEARRKLPGNVGAKFTHESKVGDYDLSNAIETAEFTKALAGGKAALKLAYANRASEYEAAYSRAIRGGQADVKVSFKDGGVGYNASYSQNVNDIADVLVGLDQEGVYGTLSASKDVAEGLVAQYEARARARVDDQGNRNAGKSPKSQSGKKAAAAGSKNKQKLGSPSMSHSLKLSSKLGYAELLHGLDEKPRLKLGYEFNVKA